MQKSILVLPDGTELSSGRGTTNALMNVQHTEKVNSKTELTPGSVCCACVEATLFAPGGALSINAGTEVTVYTEYDDGTVVQEGIFNLEKPTRSSANAYKLLAYDNVKKLDVDLTSWLHEQLPITIFELVQAVCTKCGVELENETLSHGDLKITSLPADTMTGRQILQWAAEIGAQFVRATPGGKIQFAWYSKNEERSIVPGQAEDKTLVSYFQGSLSYEDYDVAAVDKVQIRNADDDVGIVWPPDVEEGNTYIVDANPFLMSCSTNELQYVAQGIYMALMEFTYVPCKVSVPRGSGIKAGDIITVTDINGAVFNTCVMTRTVSGGKETLESTGSPVRNSSTAINNLEYSDLAKKVLKLNLSVDGLKVENKNMAKDYANLELTVKGINTEVGSAKGDISKLQQTAGQVSVEVADEMGTLLSVINTETWEVKYVDANGEEISGLKFDPIEKKFVFNANLKAGSININDKFIVDSEGNTQIAGGKFYALKDDGTMGDDLFEIDTNGLRLYRKNMPLIPIISLNKGEQDNGNIYPNVMLGSLNDEVEAIDLPCMIKRFADGLWIGNIWVDIDGNGCFVQEEDSNGIFISVVDKTTYAIVGTDRKNFYTGGTIARFG